MSMFYDVAADGQVSNIRIETQFGPQEFAENSVKAMTSMRFEPATENGKPIDYHGTGVSQTYEKSSRRIVLTDYLAALSLETAGNQGAALTALDKVLLSTDGNIYSHFMAAYSEAIIYSKMKDFDRALYYIRIAIMDDGRFLASDTFLQALHLQFAAATASGQHAEALRVYETLKKANAPTGEETKIAATLETNVSGTNPVGVRGWIHDDAFGGAWRHELFRRKFEFFKINGKLDHFELYCDGRSMTSAINETSAWIVPPSWNDCTIYVLGDSNTTFQFFEQ